MSSSSTGTGGPQEKEEDQSVSSDTSVKTRFARRPSVMQSNNTGSTLAGSGSSGIFGGGKGWESWGTEEGHRALGQAYQRSGTTSANDNDSYDVDEFGDLVSSTGSSLRNRGMLEESDTSTGTEGTDRRRSETSITNTSSSHHTSTSSEEDSAVRSGSSSSGDSPNHTAVHSRGYYSESVLHDKVIRPNLESKSTGLLPGLRSKFGKTTRTASYYGRSSFMKGMDDDDNKTHKMSSSILEGDETASNVDDSNCKDLRKPVFKLCQFECCRRSQIICVSVLLLTCVGAILLGTLLPEESATKQKVRKVARTSTQAVSNLIGLGKETKKDGDVPKVEKAPGDRRTTEIWPDLSEFFPESSVINYANVWDPYKETDTPMYWHDPRSFGSIVTDIMISCIGLGVSHGDQPLLNVHVHEDLHSASIRFDQTYKGRVFALFSHPVHQAVSVFNNYSEQSKKDPNDEESLQPKSILHFYKSSLGNDNWMVRTLTNNYEDPVTAQDVEISKNFLQQKVLVGFEELFDESMDRFQQFFHWPVNAKGCEAVKSQIGDKNNSHLQLSQAKLGKLEKLNWADMELYRYAEILFQEQAPFFNPNFDSVY